MSYYTSNEYLRIKAFWNEPDAWEDWIEDYLCMARRNHSKAWCGYVRVPVSHPMVPNENLDCHGGITWNASHVPWKDPDDLVPIFHWYGFDCNHYLDLTPEAVFRQAVSQDDSLGYDGQYRTLDYVKQNIKSLAQQLKALEEVPGHA